MNTKLVHLYIVPAPHTFLRSFGRPDKYTLWSIRHLGGEPNPHPYYYIHFNTVPAELSIREPFFAHIVGKQHYRR